ncbi:uncharacterized protein LOC130640711 [Hydractinia symbiolongicarpus]|uniref:uncharacterized protein LOC130640711 n=1 Tax=Hydractinia symbiolongicarpus TaxID=13093 RepID=UPI00254AF4DE|nr:uncharacterized protein LOC130640711 [Hydractinia symbiolongicarpus]
MASYFGRKTLRIRNLREDVAEILVKEVSNFIQLERIVKKNGTVSVCVASQLKNLVERKILSTLNKYVENANYTCENIEVKSSLVVVTNIPQDVREKDMDKMLAGFGRTLTKFQLIRKRNSNLSLKYGWIVFEDLENAERCVLSMSRVRIKSHYLQAMLLPEAINSESSLQELSTLQIEGFPLSFCSEEKIKDILKVICVDIAQSVKFIRTKTLIGNNVTRYVALIDWNSPQLAITNFQKLDTFKAADENGHSLVNLNASFALPGVTAFSDFCQSINEASNSFEVAHELSRNIRGTERCVGVRSPPPPYVEREVPPGSNNCPQPPPYTPPRPLMSHEVMQPMLFSVGPQSTIPVCPPPHVLLSVVTPPHRTHGQDAQMMNGIFYNTPVQRNQVFRPPPLVIPTQAHVMQNGRPIVVQFANHFPPLNTNKNVPPLNNVPRMSIPLHVGEVPRFNAVVLNNILPPNRPTGRGPVHGVKPVNTASLRRNIIHPVSNNTRQTTPSSTKHGQATDVCSNDASTLIIKTATTSDVNSVVSDIRENNDAPMINAECSAIDPSPCNDNNVNEKPTSTATPSTAWTQKKTNRRWSTAKKVNKNQRTSTLPNEAIIEEVVKEYAMKNEVTDTPDIETKSDFDVNETANESRPISNPDNDKSQVDTLEGFEVEITNETDKFSQGKVLHALTRMSILDTMKAYENPTSQRAVVDVESSRLMTFIHTDEAEKQRFWNRLPREMFNSLF